MNGLFKMTTRNRFNYYFKKSVTDRQIFELIRIVLSETISRISFAKVLN